MNRILSKSTRLLGAICGGLVIGLAAIPKAAEAQQVLSSQVNPCPSIFYEEPYNNRVMVPQGCPPNAFTLRMAAQGTTPIRDYPAATPTPEQIRRGVGGEAPTTGRVNVIQPPAPEQRSQPIASVTPTYGRVNVKLINNTNAIIEYEAIGHTQRRLLPGRQEIVLRNLPVAVTVSAIRQDGGFLTITPTTSDSGVLELTLNESTKPGDNQGAIRIQENGQVFLN